MAARCRPGELQKCLLDAAAVLGSARRRGKLTVALSIHLQPVSKAWAGEFSYIIYSYGRFTSKG